MCSGHTFSRPEQQVRQASHGMPPPALTHLLLQAVELTLACWAEPQKCDQTPKTASRKSWLRPPADSHTISHNTVLSRQSPLFCIFQTIMLFLIWLWQPNVKFPLAERHLAWANNYLNHIMMAVLGINMLQDLKQNTKLFSFSVMSSE